MDSVILVIHLLLALALIATILLQRTAQDGGGLTGGGSTMGGLFTARGSANLLTRTTAILATLFICTSLTLGIMASSSHKTVSIADKIEDAVPAKQETDSGKEAPAPAAPQVPVSK